MLFVLSLRRNLLSIGKIGKSGLKIVIYDGEVNIIGQNNTVITTEFRKGYLFKLILSVVDITSKLVRQ